MVTREALEKEIDVLVRIIRSHEASLKSKTTIAPARTLLEMQINTRSLALAALRQKTRRSLATRTFDALAQREMDPPPDRQFWRSP